MKLKKYNVFISENDEYLEKLYKKYMYKNISLYFKPERTMNLNHFFEKVKKANLKKVIILTSEKKFNKIIDKELQIFETEVEI